MRRTYGSTLVLAFALAACNDSSVSVLVEETPRAFLDPSYAIAVERGILFATGSVRSPAEGEKDLLLDLYRPDDAGAPALRPGFVVVHENFDTGTRTSPAAVHFAEGYASRGYVTVSMDYRRLTDDPPTEHLASDPSDPVYVAAAAARVDAARAVDWLRANAAAYGIDPDRIAMGGFSAGAITSLGVAYRAPGEDGAEVQAVVSLAGGLYGFESLIDADDAPLVMIHGTADPGVAFSLAEAIVARANDVGLVYEFYPLEGVGHALPPELDRVVDGMTLEARIAEFLYRQLELEALVGS